MQLNLDFEFLLNVLITLSHVKHSTPFVDEHFTVVSNSLFRFYDQNQGFFLKKINNWQSLLCLYVFILLLTETVNVVKSRH